MANFVPLTKDQIAAQLQLLRQTGFDLKLAAQAGANGFTPGILLRHCQPRDQLR